MTLTRLELTALVKQAHINADNLLINDDVYVLPDYAWIGSTFAVSLRQLITSLGFVYESGAENCKSFVRLSAGYAQMLHARMIATGAATPDTTLAFGEFWYIKDTGEGHAVNIFVYDDNKIAFFEPQTQQIVDLSESEQYDCVMLRI